MQDVQPMPARPAGGSHGSNAASDHSAATLSPGFAAWFDQQRRFFDDSMALHLKTLKSEFGTHSRLFDAVEYSMVRGGKRLRPTLVIETCRVCGGAERTALPAALAVECVHTFSLIHDDLPAMDDDDLRRGHPTNHKVFGEALAILAGDWLLAYAQRLVAGIGVDPRVSTALGATLAAGTLGMIEGQAADIEGETEPPDRTRVEHIHMQKTARLIEACGRLGALCACAASETIECVARYGRHLGLAFQIADDLLDYSGSAAKTGKRVGKDADNKKQTYPAAFGVTASQRRAADEIELAIAALDRLGPRAERLRDLARFTIARDR